MIMRISVVIAAYRGERFIVEQLRSLFHQARVPDEIVIGDDSQDNLTQAAVESVRGEYQGELRYIRNPERLGFVGNFLHVASMSTGDIIFFCDQDDVWLPDKIAVMSARLQQDPSCELVVCNSTLVDGTLKPLDDTLVSADGRTFAQRIDQLNHGKFFTSILYDGMGFFGHNIAMKRSYLSVFQQMPSTYSYHDSWLIQTGCFLGVLRYVNQCLTLYRIHGNNFSKPATTHARRSIIHRFHEIMSSSHDLVLLASDLEHFLCFVRRYPRFQDYPELLFYNRYLECRLRWLRLSRVSRWFRMMCHAMQLRGYFRYGLGWRSMLRDCLAPKLKEDMPVS